MASLKCTNPNCLLWQTSNKHNFRSPRSTEARNVLLFQFAMFVLLAIIHGRGCYELSCVFVHLHFCLLFASNHTNLQSTSVHHIDQLIPIYTSSGRLKGIQAPDRLTSTSDQQVCSSCRFKLLASSMVQPLPGVQSI